MLAAMKFGFSRNIVDGVVVIHVAFFGHILFIFLVSVHNNSVVFIVVVVLLAVDGVPVLL